ncbi:MAG: transporter [bacterium]
MRRLSLLSLLFAIPLAAQTPAAKDSAAAKVSPIEDNSFLVEEAYNQEYGVVQHISTYQRTRTGNWAYTFTQEWPAPSIKHQLSYTIPVLDFGTGTGVGDIALNYRYQALGSDDTPLWFAPRLSVYVPSGDEQKGRGAGGPGVEVMLPVSYAVTDVFITHWNLGANVTRVDGAGVRGTVRGLRAGASAIWLLAPTFNLMLESIATRGELLDENARRTSTTSYLISPGMRGAINFSSGLQVVPGIAFPIGVGPSSGQRDVYLYLSFEHSFR